MPLRVQNASHCCRPSGSPLLLTPGLLAMCRPPPRPHRAQASCVCGQGSLESLITASFPCDSFTQRLFQRGVGRKRLARCWEAQGRSRAWGDGRRPVDQNLREGACPSIHPRGTLFSPPVSGCLAASLRQGPAPPPTHPAVHTSVSFHPSLCAQSFSSLHRRLFEVIGDEASCPSVGSCL